MDLADENLSEGYDLKLMTAMGDPSSRDPRPISSVSDQPVMDNASESSDFVVFDKLLRERHSCRAYRSTAVPRETILRILETAQQSASDCNVQPWRVRIVSGAALDRLRVDMYDREARDFAPVRDLPGIERYEGAYLERRRQCGWGLYGALRIARGDRKRSREQLLENFRFFGAPHLAVITTHASLGPRAQLDCGAYIALFISTAHALGVASVPQGAIASRADTLREHLSISVDDHVVCGISFGFADETHRANAFRTSRASIDEVVIFHES